jgi:hypothetical protein
MKQQDIKTHLIERGMDLSIHRVFINDEENLAVFPLWNLSGQLTGYQQYRPYGSKGDNNDPREGKYFTKRLSKICFWGLETWTASNALFITEGIFDACRLTKLGYSAIALFSNNVKEYSDTAKWLRIISTFRPTVAICDNDIAGLNLAKHTTYHHIVESGDLGESSDIYIESMLEEFHYLESNRAAFEM